jgi:ankyrin repeat protein
MDNIQLPESFLSGQNYLIMPPTPSGDPTLVNTTPGSMASSYIELQHASRDSSLPSDASDVQGDRESERQSASGWLSPLHMAAKKGHEKIVRALLQHDANCNLKDSDGLTPLLHALMGGFRDIVSLLLSHGARIDEVDPQKRTALHWTVIRKQEALLKMLLEHGGAKPSIIDSYDESGRTPLHIAVEEDFEAGVQLLLQFGANVHTQARKSAL